MRIRLSWPQHEARRNRKSEKPAILVLDDSQSLRRLYKRELEHEGYEVCLAESGAEAVHLTRERRPALVVLEVGVPGMDGLEVLGQILAEDDGIPVIINSSYSCYKESFRSWSADAYLMKSSDLRELKATIHKLLGERQRANLPGGDASDARLLSV